MSGTRRFTGLVAWLFIAGPASPSSDEAWLHRAGLSPVVAPLLALLVDTSAGMNGPIDVPAPYDPGRDYSTAHPGTPCPADRIYWRRGPGPAPGCDSPRWLNRAADDPGRGWRCRAGDAALGATGTFVAGRAAQWEPRGTGGLWRDLQPMDDGAVECREDRGRHGAVAGTWFAADGSRGPWQTDDAGEPRWDAPPLSDAYVFFTGNYLNYLASDERIPATRFQWLARRLVDAARSVTGLELAVARLSHDGLGGDDDGRGGMIAVGPAGLPDAAQSVESVLRGWIPAGPAPLAEALTEVLRWLAGDPVHFGLDSHAAPGDPLPSAAAVRSTSDPTHYLTPITHACRPVMLGVATTGTASADDGSAAALAGLAARLGAAAACSGDCLAQATRLLATGDLRGTMAGLQRADLRFLAAPESFPALRSAIAASGHPALDLEDRHAILNLVAHALQNDAGVGASQRVSAAGLEHAPFAAPDAAVYYGLSAADPFPPWPGNLRRYRLAASGGPAEGPTVLDRNDGPVFDAATGHLVPGSRSEWSDVSDGADTLRGGAASRLPAPDLRRVFSDLSEEPLVASANRLSPGNPALTRERLALDPSDPRSVADLVAWALARDVFDEDADGDHDELRRPLGDPGIEAPQVLRYAAAGPALAFVATQDGLLHAFDADTGDEHWAFMPAAFLPRLAELAAGYRSHSRPHGLDGALTLTWSDRNLDGRLVAGDGDRAWLFAGLGRGGTGYFALDVSDPDAPRLLWSLAATELPGFGQSWPAAVPARMRLADGAVRRVVLLAGGFDPAEDAAVAPTRSRGAAFAIVDAEDGRVLWRAGGAGSAADVEVPAMQRSAATTPRALDSDGDGLADRIYLLDIAGQLLRFDFPRGGDIAPDASATLVATLGNGSDGVSRRFLAAPDVVPVERDGVTRLAVAAGSGWLSHPRDLDTDDAFFVVFDALPGAPASRPLASDDLADVTAPPHEAPPGAPGWMLRLGTYGPGEKVAGSAVTFDHRLRFATYQPRPPAPDAPCGPPAGVGRLYTLDIRSGRPVNWVGDQPVPDEEIVIQGLPPGLDVVFPTTAHEGCGDRRCTRRPFALVGGNSIALDFANEPVRTSWRQLDANGQ